MCSVMWCRTGGVSAPAAYVAQPVYYQMPYLAQPPTAAACV
jgi:hypothetical protein